MSITEFDFTPASHETRSENRSVDRSPVELRTIVQYKENSETAWKEVTKVTTVSRNGAGFDLKRPVVVGRMLTLVMPLPPELRAYDPDAELYPVMGLVQYCNAREIGGETLYHVGVGFVGKNIPQSYKDDPAQSYRICGMSQSGLWEIIEANSPHKPRKHSRFWLPVEFALTHITRDRSNQKEICTTHDISAGGASLPCSLNVQSGDRVKLASKEYNFYSIAIVRDRKEMPNLPANLHLEFLDGEFPVEKLLSTVVADGVEIEHF